MSRINTNSIENTPAAAIFVKPEIATQWISAEDIENTKAHLLLSQGIASMMETKADELHEYAFRQFIEQSSERLANTLNRMHAIDELLQVMVGKLSLKLQVRKNPEFNEFDNARVAPTVAFMILNTLIETGIIQYQVKTLAETNERTGKKTWRQQTVVTFGYAIPENDKFIAGVHTEPTVTQKKTKVRPGGKSTKLSSNEKRFLKEASATPLRVIDIELDIMEKYMKTSAWYQAVLRKEVNMDKLVADKLIKKQLAKFELLQSLESFHLDLWFDYRTRLYYTMSELGFNPHGKTFETSLYELAEGRYITDKGFDALAYSAVVIVEDARMAHGEAVAKFNANKAHYIGELRRTKAFLKDDNGAIALDARTEEPMEDLGKSLYNNRLATAIEDYFDAKPSHFLLGEDATNGGLQHGGIAFKSPKMMIPANVGGAPTQQDSHGNLQQLLGLTTRQEAKDIHQPLLHGSSMKTIAKTMNISEVDARQLLRTAYGHEVFNIQTIADWGVDAVDNFNTSLQWTTSDGFKAQSIAYTESVPLTLYSPSATNKAGYTQIKVHRDMPLVQDAKGNPIYGSVGDDKSQGKANKLRGLYANITHSIDGTGLRYVIRNVKKANNDVTAGGIFKHDNFLVHPNDMEHARAGYKGGLINEFQSNSYQDAMEQAARNHKGSTPMVPTLAEGTATEDMIVNSHYYLAP